ncbi:MAG: type II secretion system protein [bacterium]
MLNSDKRSALRNRAGFTMIEVVIGSAIMVLVFLALLGSVSTSRKIQSFNENRLWSLHVARQALEEYGSLAYDSTAFAVGTKTNGRAICTVSQVSGETTKNVTVVVNWIEPDKGTNSISLTSSFSRSLHK